MKNLLIEYIQNLLVEVDKNYDSDKIWYGKFRSWEGEPTKEEEENKGKNDYHRRGGATLLQLRK
jgi:hypothetical protein